MRAMELVAGHRAVSAGRSLAYLTAVVCAAALLGACSNASGTRSGTAPSPPQPADDDEPADGHCYNQHRHARPLGERSKCRDGVRLRIPSVSSTIHHRA